MRVVLAVPNYNGLPTLRRLLTQALKEDYDAVYILDDASTDGSAMAIKKHFPQVTVIASHNNVGAGGNRNRIIDHVKNGIIHFVDADMKLLTPSLASIIRRQFRNPKTCVVGSLILNSKGKPDPGNYGHELHPIRDAEARVYKKLLVAFPRNKALREYIRRNTTPSCSHLNHIHAPAQRSVDWVAEGSFAVRASVFAKVGGFDTRMREHETQDLCHRLRQLGYKIAFDPTVVTQHLALQVRDMLRDMDRWKSQYYFFQKHWQLDREKLDRLFDYPLGTTKKQSSYARIRLSR